MPNVLRKPHSICGRIPISPSRWEILFDSKVDVTIYLPCIRKDGNGIDLFQGAMQRERQH
jgi:hypothetical protein